MRRSHLMENQKLRGGPSCLEFSARASCRHGISIIAKSAPHLHTTASQYCCYPLPKGHCRLNYQITCLTLLSTSFQLLVITMFLFLDCPTSSNSKYKIQVADHYGAIVTGALQHAHARQGGVFLQGGNRLASAFRGRYAFPIDIIISTKPVRIPALRDFHSKLSSSSSTTT